MVNSIGGDSSKHDVFEANRKAWRLGTSKGFVGREHPRLVRSTACTVRSTGAPFVVVSSGVTQRLQGTL